MTVINNLNINDKILINEIVNFIFIKQSFKQYYINTFPKKIDEIKKEIQENIVLYQKNNEFNLIIVMKKEKVKYLYFSSFDIIEQCLPYLKSKQLLLTNNDHLLLSINDNQLMKFNINKVIYKHIIIKHNPKYEGKKNKNYIIKQLMPYLYDEYYDIHCGKIEENIQTLVCIKNNEMIGYLDYIDDKIINIGYTNSINNNIKYLFLIMIEYYLKHFNYKKVDYYITEEILNNCDLINYEVIDKIIYYDF